MKAIANSALCLNAFCFAAVMFFGTFAIFCVVCAPLHSRGSEIPTCSLTRPVVLVLLKDCVTARSQVQKSQPALLQGLLSLYCLRSA